MMLAAWLGNTSVQATPAQEKTEGPGYYRMRLGAYEVTALSDGLLPGSPKATPVNGYLVNTGDKLVLIDAGAGLFLGPGLGRLVANLRAAGYEPQQVDEIYITHIQPDHVGGLLIERRAAFSNATVRTSRREADYWLAKSSMAAAPAEERQRFAQIAAAFKPYVAAGRLKVFDAEAELAPGLRAMPGAGPAPGSTVYAVNSRGQTLVFWGDALDAAADGSVPFTGAAAQGWVAGAHLAFPGIGHLRAAGHRVEFVPAS
jgi:glyoxylase-like metal-dependent hydrolase (beta-lactamase superfamily II)